MTFDNIHLDHIKPMSAFILEDPVSQAVPRSTDSATEHSNAYGCATL